MARFFGEHDRIGSIVDGVNDVRHLGSCGAGVIHHGPEHLRCRDHRFPEGIGLPDQHLLDKRDSLEGGFHTQVSPGHHDSVCRGEDLVDMFQGLLSLDLGYDRDVGGRLFQERS